MVPQELKELLVPPDHKEPEEKEDIQADLENK